MNPKELIFFVKGHLGFLGITRKETKSCAQAETDGRVVNEIACANAFSELRPMLCSLLPDQGGEAVIWVCVWGSQGRPQHLTMNPTVGWKWSADVLSHLR